MDTTLLSIITINYNNVQGLQKTIQSVGQQSCTEYEFIVVDGGSTDGSNQLIEEHAGIITYAVSEKDNGIYDAMNKGIKKSSGKYLLFLNSGDYLNNNFVIEKIMPELQAETSIIACSYIANGLVFKSPSKANFSSFWYRSICHQVVFIRKELFDLYGLYNTSLKIAADWEFFVRTIFLHNATYRQLDIIVAIIENDGVSSRPEMYVTTQKERAEVYKKFFPGFVDDYERLQMYSNNRLYRIARKINNWLGKKH